jgi:hypothetical protein
MTTWISLGDVVAPLQSELSDAELVEFARLSQAITFAIRVAGEMPTTLDARARALVVTKLQEAEHWSLELVRVAAQQRSTPPP